MQEHRNTALPNQVFPLPNVTPESPLPTVSDASPHLTSVYSAQENPRPSWDTGTHLPLAGTSAIVREQGAGLCRDLIIISGDRSVTFGWTIPPQTRQASGHSLKVIPLAAALLVTL